ncbi:MAG: hypothetical protein K2G77_07885, partial [Muribaculaceae bacterium]|nr:hypothetical protein [Muribaculaceae bacterium]
YTRLVVGSVRCLYETDIWVGAAILTLAIALCVAGLAAVLLRLLPKVAAWILTALFAVLLVGCSMPATTQLSFFLCVVGGIGLGLAEFRLYWRKTVNIDLSPLLVGVTYWMFGFGALLTACIIILFAVRRCVAKLDRKTWWITSVCAAIIAIGLPAILCKGYALPYVKALLYPGIAKPELPQMKYERRLAISDAFYRRDYTVAKQLAERDENPDEVTAFYYYLSSAVQDSLPDNLLKYPVKSLGTLTTIGETTPPIIINMMNDLYYELGDMTYAERAAMMRNVFSPRNRNVRMIRRLAEINLVSGDTAAAMKYLRVLDRTHAYSDWSRCHTPGTMTPEVEADISNRRTRSNDKDNIRLGDNCRNIILELLESNPRNTVALDYLLCTDLLLKDMDTFKMDYDTYCMEKGEPRYKDLYQQALMIYLAGTDATQEEWDRYIVPGAQQQAFRAYSSRRGDPTFNGTYWYYFDRGA